MKYKSILEVEKQEKRKKAGQDTLLPKETFHCFSRENRKRVEEFRIRKHRSAKQAERQIRMILLGSVLYGRFLKYSRIAMSEKDLN